MISQFEAEAKTLPEFERAIKLEESVVRFLVVAQGPEPAKPVPVEAPAGAEEDDE